jgi:hypothetical protein
MRFAVPIALAFTLAGCIDVVTPPEGVEPMCEVTADCDVAEGEICDQGICWGDPPENTRFAAILIPPEGQPDLVPTELPALSIGDDGTVPGLDFVAAKTLSGKVRLLCDASAACDPMASVSARITVKRASRIPGGPAYKRTVVSQAGVREGPAFTLRLPPTGASDGSYEVTITPDDTGVEAGESPAALAPPIRFSLAVTADMNGLDWVLGNPEELKVVKGRVVDAASRGLPGMQVWALGKWSALSDLERASSIATTDADGWFKIRIPTAMLDVFDLVVKPAPGTTAPSLRKLNVVIPDPQLGEEYVSLDGDLRMPSFAAPVPYVVPVRGFDSSGELQPVAGAEVRLTTVLLQDGDGVATYTASAYSDAQGHARFDLIPGGGQQNRLYLARVLPPAGAKHASLFDAEITVGLANPDGDSWLPTLQLGDRVPVTGTVVDAGGHVVGGATVSASASLGFVLGLDQGARSTLDNLQLPSATTDAAGLFLIWVDPTLVGLDAVYDLEITPPTGSQAPRWTVRAVGAAQSSSGALDLGDLWLPPASYARGPVRTPAGDPVPAAEVRLYEVPDETVAMCAGVVDPFGDDECESPAILRGLWQTRPDGVVWMALPDPP